MRRLWIVAGLLALIGLPRLAHAEELCFADATPDSAALYDSAGHLISYWEDRP